jgi:hypothetical protein
MYIMYSTPWSEGEVVAHTSDKSFAVGMDHSTGSIVRVNTLQELLEIQDLVLSTTSNVDLAIRRDSAWYGREASDLVEFEKYKNMWLEEYSYESQN